MTGIILKIDDLYVGRVNAAEYGYTRGTLKVTVDIELKRDDRTRETTEHAEIVNPLDFSMSAAVWNQRGTDHVSGGQIREVLGNLIIFADSFDAGKAAKLAALWERWHLNTMRAGCAHVTPVYQMDRYQRRVVDMDSTPACNHDRYVSGPDGERILKRYRYGSAWLTEPLPEGFETELRALLPAGGQDSSDPASPDLKAMMERDGIGARISRKPQAPRRSTWGQDADWWTAYFRGPERNMTISYGVGKGCNGRRPAADEILSSVLDEALTYENAPTFEAYADEFGLEADDKNARRTFVKLEKQAWRLRSFLGDKYDEYVSKKGQPDDGE